MKLPSMSELRRLSAYLTPDKVAEIKTSVSEELAVQAALVDYMAAYDARVTAFSTPQGSRPTPPELEQQFILAKEEEGALTLLRAAARPVVLRIKAAHEHADEPGLFDEPPA